MSYGNKYCLLKSVIRLLCAKYNNLIINSCSGQGHCEKQRRLLLHVWNVLINFFIWIFLFLFLLPFSFHGIARTYFLVLAVLSSCASSLDVLFCKWLGFEQIVILCTFQRSVSVVLEDEYDKNSAGNVEHVVLRFVSYFCLLMPPQCLPIICKYFIDM